MRYTEVATSSGYAGGVVTQSEYIHRRMIEWSNERDLTSSDSGLLLLPNPLLFDAHGSAAGGECSDERWTAPASPVHCLL